VQLTALASVHPFLPQIVLVAREPIVQHQQYGVRNRIFPIE
jgi:hypothetical protein